MRCERITPYLPGFAGEELRADTRDVVAGHLAECADCRGRLAGLTRARAALASLANRELEPPPFLLDGILDSVAGESRRRLLPVPPIAIADLAAVLSEHREAIASAAGTALVAAGAAYAVWRAVRSRTAGEPATS